MRAHRGQLIKASKELIECHDQLLGRALRRQAGETFDISKQYAEREEVVVEEGEEYRHTVERSNKEDTQ